EESEERDDHLLPM
nr:Chain E, Cation-dependent mannose-6-phosphate receptor [synthetic construct]1JUQ_F Chain F, Cation-dependent mannose-6-phosphate receptor [synthetic construct]1JUQ_G Chain G, Cation-dependent mannose-6-phosphate receptor [synthetic construct]1JUQ_H Chain H, Cation-dependent mannose-6-phosphate receptor [synthetic construct]